jgi:PAS domain S-box-containing protein
MPPVTIAGQDEDFETRLRVELERWTAVTPAMLHSIDEKGLLISVSDAWLAKLGYARGEVLGRPSSAFSQPSLGNTRSRMCCRNSSGSAVVRTCSTRWSARTAA